MQSTNVTVTTFVGIVLWYATKYFIYAGLGNQHDKIFSVLRRLPKINVVALLCAMITAVVIVHSRNCTHLIDNAALACLVVSAASLLVAGLETQQHTDDAATQANVRHPYNVACMAAFVFVIGAAGQTFPSDMCSSVALVSGSTVTAGLFLVVQYNSYSQRRAAATRTVHGTTRTAPPSMP